MPHSSKKSPNRPMGIQRPLAATKKRISSYLKRRPHRSFRLTRRRDYRRSLKLPGYIAFTFEVNRTLKRFRKPFLWLALFYAVMSAVLVGLGSQDIYSTLTDTLRQTGSEVFDGNFAEVGKAGLILLTIATTGLSTTPTEAQQIAGVFLAVMVWLTTVWLLRNLLAGHRVRMRDGLYSAGAPLIPMALISLVLFVQALPLALAALGYGAAASTGLLANGVEAMLFWIAAILLVAMSLYWMTSTFFALVVVTLPGMYPMQALRTAGDMVIGRRIRILLRVLWMFLCLAIGWTVILLPLILLDTWLKGVWPQIQWLPIIPVALLVVSTMSAIWASSYVYLLYRKVVDDNAKPA